MTQFVHAQEADESRHIAQLEAEVHRLRGSVMRVAVTNEELVTVRDAMRGLNHMVDELTAGDASKFVLTKGGKMYAVVLSVDDYARLMGQRLPIMGNLAAEQDRARP